jgi:hypothetical protein
LSPDAYARPIYSSDRRGPDGSYSYEYQTDNAIKVKQESTGYGANKVVRGYYSYVGNDGITYTVNYIADRFGYRAYGAHLPTQPDAVYDQTKLPVYNNQPVNIRPVNNPYYITSTPAPPSVYPLQQQNHQHQTQTVYYPQSPLSSQHIYVTESVPSNYINITPKPFNHNNHFQTSTQLPVNILPPYYISSSPEYSNQPYAWTTSKPQSYNYGYSSTTPRPYVSY